MNITRTVGALETTVTEAGVARAGHTVGPKLLYSTGKSFQRLHDPLPPAADALQFGSTAGPCRPKSNVG